MTTAIAKTIQIYLPTGEPRGIRIADITTRLVLAVLIPRSELASGKLRWELDHPGPHPILGIGTACSKPKRLVATSWTMGSCHDVYRVTEETESTDERAAVSRSITPA